MIFGVPKELSGFKDTPEMRVSLSPMGARELIHHGARVYVETKAGAGAGFTDEEYAEAGAQIVFSKEEAYRRSDIILKVRRPQPAEYDFIDEGKIMTGFMHLLTAPKEFIELAKSKKMTIIGLEIIQDDGGRLPIEIPMSDMTGKLAVQLAGRLLESREGGRGILLSGIAGIPPAEVVILGGGTLGQSAARAFAGIGANVHVLDLDRDRLDEISRRASGMKITTMYSIRHNIEKMARFADVLVGAVHVPRKRTPILVTAGMIKNMQKGAVFLDFSIDQGGCSETSQVDPSGDFIYRVDHVIHFCMPNATSLVARTASHTITAAFIPYLRIIANQGIDQALRENKDLDRGIYVEKGEIRKEFIT